MEMNKNKSEVVDNVSEDETNPSKSNSNSILTQPLDFSKATPWVKDRLILWIIGAAIIPLWIWLITPSQPNHPPVNIQRLLETSPDKSRSVSNANSLSDDDSLIEDSSNNELNQKDRQSRNLLNNVESSNFDGNSNQAQDDINAFDKFKSK